MAEYTGGEAKSVTLPYREGDSAKSTTLPFQLAAAAQAGTYAMEEGTEESPMPNRIKYYRKRCGLTQRQLAARIYCGVNSLSAWENGRRIPSVDSVLMLARELGASVEALFGEEQPCK